MNLWQRHKKVDCKFALSISIYVALALNLDKLNLAAFIMKLQNFEIVDKPLHEIEVSLNSKIGVIHYRVLNCGVYDTMYHQQQNKWYQCRYLLAHFEATFDFSHSEFSFT